MLHSRTQQNSKLQAQPSICIKRASDRMENHRKLQGVFQNQFVFEVKWEETYTEATQAKQKLRYNGKPQQKIHFKPTT